ncbi:hypothetical protein PCASD_01230 [Puccinia coronata f. sp. avenae]|uniref:Uncharacterized protein n=1 Tax=Puccinia coronata f. sp. avenae TaxID=200324 RepID=A0A2N5VLU8_9BASI|nr:hypothetical protein PCASD_17301 [Puccinia coronata f. sp. avenae]PLW50957.1 hypothetical protein PCASD_01230 [Puccinia coronata f. sp. avenae]
MAGAWILHTLIIYSQGRTGPKPADPTEAHDPDCGWTSGQRSSTLRRAWEVSLFRCSSHESREKKNELPYPVSSRPSLIEKTHEKVDRSGGPRADPRRQGLQPSAWRQDSISSFEGLRPRQDYAGSSSPPVADIGYDRVLYDPAQQLIAVKIQGDSIPISSSASDSQTNHEL